VCVSENIQHTLSSILSHVYNNTIYKNYAVRSVMIHMLNRIEVCGLLNELDSLKNLFHYLTMGNGRVVGQE
jgi:hypothetical protein